MKFCRKLPSAEELRERFQIDKVYLSKRKEFISEIKEVLSGSLNKKIIIIGPCSADSEDAVIDYMIKLKKISEFVNKKLLIIPRVYTSKPRTNGLGYKGMIHRPNAESGIDDIYSGIIKCRELHVKVIKETEMFPADEMLYPDIFYYNADLLSYAAVGARSVEDQQHRLLASGLDIPVGMKNPTSGDLNVLVNAVYAAHNKQRYVCNGYECESSGNIYAHAILRGFTDTNGNMHPNYHIEDIIELFDKFQKMNLRLNNVIIDCNHANSNKHYDHQIHISKEVFSNCKQHDYINKFVKGLMIESYLLDGAQLIGENIYGKSITDPCLGIDKTERLIKELAEML